MGMVICLLGTPPHQMVLLYTVVSPFEGKGGGAGHSLEVVVQAMLKMVAVAVSGSPLVHYCTRVGFVQGVAIGRRECH